MEVFAPWTDEQVKSINEFQASGKMHPLTCGNRDRAPLIAYTDGLACSFCDYRQNWCPEFALKWKSPIIKEPK
jgi:hypothetical protein